MTPIARPAYYDRIAQQWHAVTGSQGGAVKRYLLNDLLRERIGDIGALAILELGAGNGYFLHWLGQQRPGQTPARVVVTDLSAKLLGLAQRAHRVARAEYLVLDAAEPLPFDGGSFDLVLAQMLFCELPAPAFHQSIRECARVLPPGGKLLATVPHPTFVAGLARRGQLRPLAGELWTLPGAGGLRLPVVTRLVAEYEAALTQAGFAVATEDVLPDERIWAEKPGLRHAGGGPLAMLIEARREPHHVGPPREVEP